MHGTHGPHSTTGSFSVNTKRCKVCDVWVQPCCWGIRPRKHTCSLHNFLEWIGHGRFRQTVRQKKHSTFVYLQVHAFAQNIVMVFDGTNYWLYSCFAYSQFPQWRKCKIMDKVSFWNHKDTAACCPLSFKENQLLWRLIYKVSNQLQLAQLFEERKTHVWPAPLVYQKEFGKRQYKDHIRQQQSLLAWKAAKLKTSWIYWTVRNCDLLCSRKIHCTDQKLQK